MVGREIFKIRDIERFCHTRIESRRIPKAKDVKASKAQSILDSVTQIAENEDLTDMISLIETGMADSELTSLDIAAAFLKKEMGSGEGEVKDSDFIAYRENEGKRSGRGSRERGRYKDYGDHGDRGNHRDHGNHRDRRSRGRNDGEWFGKKDVRSRDIGSDGSVKPKKKIVQFGFPKKKKHGPKH